MYSETWRVIASNHPSLAGHFPGDPIVPGVVILEEVIQALEGWRSGCRLEGVPAVKFLAPLRPEEVFTIRLALQGAHSVSFECRRQGRLLAQGQLEVSFKDTM